MLQQLRRGAGSWVAKLLLGLLVISFGLWGIGDVFSNFGGSTLASVGRTDVPLELFRKDYDAQRQLLARQAGRPISNEQAERLGLRGRVLGKLIASATFDEQARRMGLNVSEGFIVREIMQDPAFFGTTGSFDRMKFERLLYGANFNEPMYVRERMVLAKRRMLAESLSSGVEMPPLFNEAANRIKNEKRIAEYILLTPEKFAKIAAPTEAELAKYYDLVKPAYNTIERRRLKLVTLKPEDFAKDISVSDDEARKVYDSQADKFSKPERREIEQIIFPDEQTAQLLELPPKAATIDALVANNKITRNSLGLITRKEIIDPAVAEAAFSLPLNAYSNLIKGQFGPVIVRATKIEPGQTVSFEKAKTEIKREIALARARDSIFDMHDKVENERASGARLDEIATKLKLNVTTTPSVDRQGLTEAGKSAGIEPAVLDDAFAADQGVDNEPIQLPNQSWIWFEVDNIDAERERPLPEVRRQVEEQWLANQQRIALSEKAKTLLDEMKSGKTIAAIAREQQLSLKTTPPFTRESKLADFSASAVNSAFRVPVNGYDTGLSANNRDRVIFLITKSETPPQAGTDERLAKSVSANMRDDLLYQFIAAVQQDAGLHVNNRLLQRLSGEQQ